jgi:hypothetical protein
MNKPAQLALAHRPTAQPGPQFDGTAPAGPQIGGANPSKPILAERTQAHGQRLYNSVINHFDILRKQSQRNARTKPTWKNVIKTMFEDERNEPCWYEHGDSRFH